MVWVCRGGTGRGGDGGIEERVGNQSPQVDYALPLRITCPGCAFRQL